MTAAAAAMLGIVAAAAATVVAVETPQPRPRPAATGAVSILATAVRAQAVVAGVVAKPARVDVHGWRADLRIDHVLRGGLRLGDTVTIAWEELSPAREVRFADGQRVLVVLDPLPTQSLWRQRFPTRDRTGAVLVVAASGEAFLSQPDGVTLNVLGHYLAMAPEARDGAPGALRLAELVRGAHPAIAREALGVLENNTPLAAELGADGAEPLLAAARSSEREAALRGAALRLAARQRLPGTRETALALAEPGSPLRADAYRALAALPDGLAADRIEALLADADPELRVVGIEVGGARVARARLVDLARGDPAPPVRLAAGRALVSRHRGAAIPDVIARLDDADATVRSGIAESIGALGDDAVAPLRAVVDGGSERAAFAAILGLSRAGRRGGTAIAAIAATHRSESVRAFARLALGKAPGHTH